MPFVINSIDKSTPLGEAIDNYVQQEKKKSYLLGLINGIGVGIMIFTLISKRK